MMLARFNYLGLIFAMTWSIHASGTIVVKANVSGCSVYIDGIHVGITPVEYEAPEGEHSVYVTKQYYETFKTKVFVEENIVCRVEATLDSKRDLGKTEISKGMTQLGRGNLTVKTNPSFGSKVYLDGTYLFEAPQTQKGISAGQYELRIAFAGDMGNADTSMRIEINDNKTLAVEIDWNMHFSNLKKGVGALLIDGYAEQYALVHDGSQAMVRNGKTIGGLNPGTYSLVVVDPRFVSEELTVDIQGGAITKISEWEPKYLVSAPPPPVKQPSLLPEYEMEEYLDSADSIVFVKNYKKKEVALTAVSWPIASYSFLNLLGCLFFAPVEPDRGDYSFDNNGISAEYEDAYAEYSAKRRPFLAYFFVSVPISFGTAIALVNIERRVKRKKQLEWLSLPRRSRSRAIEINVERNLEMKEAYSEQMARRENEIRLLEEIKESNAARGVKTAIVKTEPIIDDF